jgi:hypothetical protein
MGHYIPLLQETFDAGCRALAFSAPAATLLPRERRAGRLGVLRELPALEAVVVEHSRHAHGDVSTGVRAQAWRCLALSAGTPGEKKGMTALRGNAFLLCVVLIVLDQDDHPVQQLNYFHTTPFAADTLKDSVEHYAEHMKLPLQWRYSLLHVDDDELRLTVLEANELQVNTPDAARQTSYRRDH